MTFQNVIQLEFFMVGADTLDQVRSECARRVMDEARIKFAVRFFDQDYRVENLVRRCDNTERKKIALAKKIFKMKEGWGRTIFDAWFRHLASRHATQTKATKRAAIGVFKKRLEEARRSDSNRILAVELPDRTFRPARQNELHELSESSARAKNVWVFIFVTPDLFFEICMGSAKVM